MSELFSFRGRANRARYWLISLVSLFIILALSVAVFLGVSAGVGAALLLLVFLIPLCWIGLALGTRRLHDRDKSGWWLLIFYVAPSILQFTGDRIEGNLALIFYLPSIALYLWGLVELGFLKGTDGPNQYGPDPLQPVAGVQPA